MTQPMIPPRDERPYNYDEDEIDLKQLFNTLLSRKWTIILTALLVTLLAAVYLYLKPSTYESYSIVDIKVQENKSNIDPNDLMFGGLSSFTNDEVDKEMALYKTYSVNQKVLDLVPYDVQYFVKNDFKTIELYDDAPIEIAHIEIFNKELLGNEFTISPFDEKHFTLKIANKGLLKRFSEPYLEEQYRYDAYIQTEDFQFEVSKKKDFLEPTIIQFNGSSRDIYENIIKPNLQVSRLDKKSSLIKISYRDTIPERAETYINTLSELFSTLNISDKSEKNAKVLNSIDMQLSEIQKHLSGAENEIEAYKVSENIVSPDEQASSLIAKLSKIDFELTQAQLKYSIITKIDKSMGYGKNIDAVSLSLSELGDQKISLLFDSLQMAQLKKAELSIDFKETFPELIKVELKIKNLKKMIKSSINSLQRTLFNKVNGLKKAKVAAEKILKTFPEKERKLVNYSRTYDVNSKMYTYLLRLKAEKTIAQSSILSDFKVVDEAYTDKGSEKPKDKLVLMVSAITGLILGIFLAFAREFFDETLKDLESLDSHTTLPVFGFIPLLKKKMTKAEVFEDRHSSFSESFREIRNNIRATYGSNSSKTILVTSSISTEGKTVTSVNLGSILALADYKCIIINLDLRKPMLHKYFSMDNKNGMSSYLQGQDSLEDVIHATSHKGLDIISAGPIPVNPSELLLKQELDDLLIYLKEHYDYVIIDSAPIGLVTDALELLNKVDLSLFVMREGVTKKGHINNINRLVKANYLDNVSIVANGMQNSKNSRYGYGYGYGSYGDERLVASHA